MNLTQHEAINLVLQERDAQDRKWGVQDHLVSTWLEILVEEVGEVAKADLECRFGGAPPINIFRETVQVAAVALAMVEAQLRRQKYPGPGPT